MSSSPSDSPLMPRERTESVLDDLVNSAGNVFNVSEEMAAENDEKVEEMSNLQLKMAIESLDGLSQISDSNIKQYDKTKLRSLINFLKKKQTQILKLNKSVEGKKQIDQVYHIVVMAAYCA